MEFTVDTIQFANVAKVLIKGLDMKDEVSQALLKLDGDKLIIQCTSQTTFFKGEIPVSHVNKETNEVTEWAVDGKQLTTILSILPSFPMDAKFTISSSNRQFNITTRNGKFKLPVNDHVIEYNMEDVTVLSEIDSTEFMKNFTRASKFLDSEPLSTASATSCLHLIFDDKIKMVGTNGFSLVEIAVEHDLKVDSDDTPIVLLRSNQLNLLANAFEANTTLTLIESNNLFGYKDSNNIIALVSKADINPLAYEILKTRVSDEQTITFDTNSLRFATNSMFKLCPTSDLIHYVINDDTMAVNDNEDDMKLTVIDKSADDITLTFSKISLLPVFNVLEENVQLTWAEDTPEIVKFNVLKEDGTVDENVFIGVTLYDEED